MFLRANVADYRVVGWTMANHLGHVLALAMLDMAIARQQSAPGLVHHANRGVLCAARGYRYALLNEPQGELLG